MLNVTIHFVMPGFDYRDVVGRATQEAKAEIRHPVNNCFYWIPAFAGMTAFLNLMF